MDESHQRGTALSSQLCGTFSALVVGTPELPRLVLPGGLRSGVPFSSIPPTPCSIKLPRTALPHATLRCATSNSTLQHCVPAFLYMSPSHNGGADTPHMLPTAFPLPAAFPIPAFAPLAVADTLAKSPSPMKGVLSSTSEQDLCSMHRAQARAKQYQLSEARLNLCGRAL